ncbi:MAG: transcriptional regulator [Succinivibrionaceae bacterium]
MKKIVLFLLTVCNAIACTSTIPSRPNDLCSIFKEFPHWYDDAVAVYKERGVPINSVMSIIYHESGYRSDVKPPMRWFLFIPYGRGSTAYGYPQAQDPVWNDYKNETDRFFLSRTNFYDSLDFVSWYMLKTKKVNGVPLSNVYAHYINYHDGWGGYKKKLYLKNSKLQNIAKNVEKLSRQYAQQLKDCKL